MTEIRTRRAATHAASHPARPTEDLKKNLNFEPLEELDESRHPLEDSGCTKSASSDNEDDDEVIEDSVLDEMQRFEETFRGISSRYRLINRIGEGTFSTVYKAEDLHYSKYRNEWDIEEKENRQIEKMSPHSKRRAHQQQSSPHYVAIKKIYVTSSPYRILNELDLLHDLRHYPSICPLITAFRHQDQVIAILPYFRHLDFRTYFRDLSIADMRVYFRSLFLALGAVHSHNILHRDIKPTNFLYDTHRKRGVLVDFGLAERQGTDNQPCLCQLNHNDRRKRVESSFFATHEPIHGYPRDDTRPSQRANRAGTRGFRAPEVLFKCTAQTTKIDVWSAGIILLTILCRRFPFFHSADDIDAVIELTTLFGRLKMRHCAILHGQLLETNIPTVTERGHSLEKIMLWSINRPTRDSKGNRLGLKDGEPEALDFLEKCLELDPRKRISAEDALDHVFLKDVGVGSEDEMDVLSM